MTWSFEQVVTLMDKNRYSWITLCCNIIYFFQCSTMHWEGWKSYQCSRALGKVNITWPRVVENMKKQWKHKSLSKKTTIEVQLVFYGPLVVLISWICTNWSIWLQPCTFNLFSICFYIICSILWYFHCLLNHRATCE